MVQVYSESDFKKSGLRRKKLLAVYLAATAAAIGLCVLFILMRNSWNRDLMLFLNAALTAAWGAFTMGFFSLKYAPVFKYIKFLKAYKAGITDEGSGIFLRFEDEIKTQYGVKVYAMVCEVKVVKRQDFPERRILIDREKAKPDIQEGQKVKFRTHGGVLVAYDIIEQQNLSSPPDAR